MNYWNLAMWVEVGDGTKNANSLLQIVNEIIKDSAGKVRAEEKHHSSLITHHSAVTRS
jgi:hypothetical protein